MNPTTSLTRFALELPKILLPKQDIDLSLWSVIACDQYTQDREYWEQLNTDVGDRPSTLRIILPEVYLEDGDRASRLASIRKAMKGYLSAEGGVFAEPLTGFIYIERDTAYGRRRKGLVASIDLDAYEWKPDSKAMIRATEATIVDRIPPRMEIRRGAPLESPHIMLLVNDPERRLVEGTGKLVTKGKPAYQTPLKPDSGAIAGWLAASAEALDHISESLETIAAKNTDADGNVFLFAVGDGNHSLATAKAVWDEYRAAQLAEAGSNRDSALRELACHPARYALVEIVNLYDEGLTFEPIHRVLFGTTERQLSSFLKDRLGGSIARVTSAHELEHLVEEQGKTRFGFASTEGMTVLDSPDPALAVARLQPALDDFLASRPEASIDYIHGTEEVFRLAKKAGAVSMLLPPVEKDSFFTTIAGGGPLPRKSFSMGEASEKRFYLECRGLFS